LRISKLASITGKSESDPISIATKGLLMSWSPYSIVAQATGT
jgi:hypothetical protein